MSSIRMGLSVRILPVPPTRNNLATETDEGPRKITTFFVNSEFGRLRKDLRRVYRTLDEYRSSGGLAWLEAIETSQRAL
jgi:hypothetical protein